MKTLCTDIVPIIVTYNPDISTLKSAIKALSSQVETIVIVDNGSNDDIGTFLDTLTETAVNKIKLLTLKQNYGLGAAYNRGIAIARQLGAEFILLLDHDSIPQQNMLEKLRNAFVYLKEQGKPIAAVGPRYSFPDKTYLSEFIRITPKGFERVPVSYTHLTLPTILLV